MNNYRLELTEEELNFIYDRCSNKAARLEDVNLEDTPCYRLAHQVMHKIYEARKEDTPPPAVLLKIKESDYLDLVLNNKVRKDVIYLIKEDAEPIDPDTISEPTKSTRDYWAEDVKHMQELSDWMNKQWNT